MTETNLPHQSISVVRRSSRVITQTKAYSPIMAGNYYAYATAQMAEQEVLYPYDNFFFRYVSLYNELDMTAVIMTRISLKAGLKKWIKKF